MRKLYHFTLGFPKGLRTKFGVIAITYTHTAQLAAEDGKYGRMTLPSTINTSKARCIEAEVKDRVVTKLVYIVKYNHTLNMTLVISRDLSVRAVRFSERSDKLKISNKDRYTIPPKAKR